MATTPTTPTPIPAKRARKANGKTASAKHTITLTFEDKYSTLYDELVQAAEDDDRPVPQYVLLFLRDNHQTTQQSNVRQGAE